MRATLKKYFIPHEHNNYHPNVLHTKRAVLYGCVGVASKAIVVLSVITFPISAFMAPDVLSVQVQNIMALTNDLRAQKNLPPYTVAPTLARSSKNKVDDMAAVQYFSHTNPDGRTITSWITEAGYDYDVAGENLAMGFHTAEDIVAAWTKSPTHYANLVDSEFKDFGVGIASGAYGGAQTIYVAQHFGAPRALPAPKKEKKSPITIQRSSSHVDWNANNQGTVLSATASIDGPVKKAEVHVRDQTIPLQPVAQGQYVGQTTISEKPDEIFKAVIPPALTIADEQGEVVRDTIDWTNVKPVEPSVVEKYRFAKSIGPAISDLFAASRWVYIGFIFLFSLALFLNIVIEFRKQHPHIIIQTLALIGLFAFLLKV